MRDSNESSNDKASSSHIPPPLDPFPTYQTSYPRHPSETEQNPFIQFRQYADTQLSSLFNNLSKTFGPSNLDRYPGRTNSPVLATDGEQMTEDQLHIVREKKKEADEENERWNMFARGMARCPGLRQSALSDCPSGEPKTELDLYGELDQFTDNVFGNTTMPDHRLQEEGREPVRYKRSWLPSLGWDGMRRSIAPRQISEGSLVTPDDSNIDDEHEMRHDTLSFTPENPLDWLLKSEYSPLKLEAQVGSPCSFQQDLACNVDWQGAFEDLMLVSDQDDPWVQEVGPLHHALTVVDGIIGHLLKQGDPGSRRADVCREPVSEQISELEQQLLKDWRRVWNKMTSNSVIIRGTEEQQSCNSEDIRVVDPEDILGCIDYAHKQESQLQRFERESQQRQQEEEEEDAEAVPTAHRIPQSQSWSSPSAHASQSADVYQPNSLLSALTTTRTITHADGSVETRTVLKRRFADGRVESDESVEFQHPQPATLSSIKSKPSQTDPEAQKATSETTSRVAHGAGNGWFWN